MTIDHKYPYGGKNRGETLTGHLYNSLVKNNYPKDKYQLSCYNCNCSKNNNEFCPHQKPININEFILKNNFINKLYSLEKICRNCGILLNLNNIIKIKIVI